MSSWGFPHDTVLKYLPDNEGDIGDSVSIPGLGGSPGVGPIPVQPIPVFLPRKFHGQRSLMSYSPWGHKELDPTERLSKSTVSYFDLYY